MAVIRPLPEEIPSGYSFGRRRFERFVALVPPVPETDLELWDTINVVASAAGQGEVTGPVQSVLFGAVGDGKDQAEVNGVDGFEYIFVGKVVVAIANFALRLEPNALDADDFGLDFDAGASLPTALIGLNMIDAVQTAPGTCTFESSFHGYDGEIRVFRSRAMCRQDGVSVNPAHYNLRAGFANWEDLIAVLDRFRVFCTPGAGLGVGSRFKLYRLKGEL